MRKALRIILMSSGIISVVSAVVLGYIYVEDIYGYIKKVRVGFPSKLNNKKTGEEYES